jgi:hypothetical protein
LLAEPPPLDPLQEQQQVDAGERAFQQAYQREQEFQRERQEAFAHIDRIQERIKDFGVPDDYAKLTIREMADEDPRLDVAWKARNVDPVACRAEWHRINGLLQQARANPSLTNPQEMAAAEQWLWQLQVAMHARTILKQAEAAVVAKARSKRRPDAGATEDRAAVVHAVRGASDEHVPEPEVSWGELTDQQFAAEKRKLGF